MENVLAPLSFTKSDFEHVRARLRELTGIALTEVKSEMVYSRLSRRLRALKLSSFSAYLCLVDTQPGEREAFVNALTTNLTSFFREPEHFSVLAAFFASQRPPFRIWSAAASTGEEAYSIAMTACEEFDSLEPSCAILGTDVNTEVLDAARSGIYSIEECKPLSTQRLRTFFLRGTNQWEGYACAIPQLRNLVTFRHMNLQDRPWAFNAPFDVIFCRNVLIYFDKPAQHDLIDRMLAFLRPGGLLFTGHSELIAGFGDRLRAAGRTVYERIAP